ncbi:MAG: hypothetical protein QNJ54_33190 [Prochloraceae cyanobacterium]|nr:hypothetical protein [Prochloraceae cyanobacterium]
MPICLKIGKQRIEEKIEQLRVKYSERDDLDFRTMILDFLSNEISEIKTWRLLKKEIVSLKLYNTNRLFEKARLLLYESLLPLENNQPAQVNLTLVKEAGQIIYEAKGMKGMKDKLLWNFIPKSCYQLIHKTWNGIGKW